MAVNKPTTALPDYEWNEWHGTNTMTKNAEDLPKGYSPDSLNWLTGWDDAQQRSDHIELRLGMNLLGDRKTGSTFVSGLGVGTKANGTQIPFWCAGQNVYYYDATSLTNISALTLPSAAANDWVSIEGFSGLGGNFVYVSSYNSSCYRIPVANPTSYIDVNSGQTPANRFQGFLNFVNSRMNLWQRNGGQSTSANKTDFFLSQSDFATFGNVNSQTANTATQLPAYPLLGAGETVGSGDGTTKAFTHTFTNQKGGSVSNVVILGATTSITSVSAATAANPCVLTVGDASQLSVGQYILIEGITGNMGTDVLNDAILQITNISGTSVTVNADTTGKTYSSAGTVYAVEYFTDDQNGTLTSNNGGTGTINYGTGAISLTFNTAPLNGTTIVALYWYWQPLTGVEYFIPDSTLKDNVSAEFFRQRDGGGYLQCVQPFGGSNYCFHTYRTWVETTAPDASSSDTNIPYRNNIGTQFYKGAWPTGDGIIFLDYSIPAHPKFQQLAIAPNTTYQTIEPFDLGKAIDFSIYAFDYVNVMLFDHYYLICCQSQVNGSKRTFNDTVFLYDSRSGYWSRLDYPVSALAQYNGTLLGGLSISPNVYTLFSGYDDDGSPIDNYWLSKVENLSFSGLKTTQRFVIRGLMQTAQTLQIYIAYDYGSFTLVKTINGTDSCVSQGNPQLIGNNTIGSNFVGGGIIYANPFELDFNLASPAYQYIQIKLVATGLGYIEIDSWALKTNQMKSLQIQPANTAN